MRCQKFMRIASAFALAVGLLNVASPQAASDDGLLFYVSGDHGLTADHAAGDPEPNFLDHVSIVPTGVNGGAIQAEDNEVLSWQAPKNIYAQRGTLSFFWRARYPLSDTAFPIFRVAYADHTSWDMVWLRIDWNGHGFDAFVTDIGLARTRVSFKMDQMPSPDAWTHLAFTWDENTGVRLFVNGKTVASTEHKAVYDAGLDQFGPHSRVIAPHQVQSRYNFLRGGDLDEIRIYDHALDAARIADLANAEAPTVTAAAPRSLADAATRAEWMLRWGWNRKNDLPVTLKDESTSIQALAFTDAKDLKEWMWKATDGIEETTWPGVYNRSRLPGRDDYFHLPDWNVYVEGGKALSLTLPDKDWNLVQIQGTAFGELQAAESGGDFNNIARRDAAQSRTWTQTSQTRHGGKLRFVNDAQETPIQEIEAFNVQAGAAPQGTHRLSYTIDPSVLPDWTSLDALKTWINGRHPADEAAIVAAVPNRAPVRTRDVDTVVKGHLPYVHVLIPQGFSDTPAGEPLFRNWNYGWENMHDGLDGIEIDLPALTATPMANGLIPLDIQVRDPIWPARKMIDIEVSVPAGKPRRIWLDLRDRILPNAPLYLSFASGSADFNAEQLAGTRIDLVFKSRNEAKVEHIADRFNQVRDNWAFLVEEHTSSRRERLYERLFNDITDLLRIDPDNELARYYWADISFGSQGWPAFEQPQAPAGEPLWAFRQLEDLGYVRRFVNWWIDERQVDYGDFGGGISDDTDLTQQWPGLALMGVDRAKITHSLDKLVEAVYKNGMITNGLGTIQTDELHAYEEGLNSNGEALYLHWGNPKTVERLMETSRALHRVVMENPNGHVLFASDYYSGTNVVRAPPWNWGKPYSFMVLHAPILMGDYDANPDARKMLIGLADGYLAHGKYNKDKGYWDYPDEINFDTDAERGKSLYGASGETGPMQVFWAAWNWTGDEKYLQPILSRITVKGLGSLRDINDNVIDALGKREAWHDELVKRGDSPNASEFDLYQAWQETGDKHYLESLHAHGIQEKAQTFYMHTEGHWWSDRVEMDSTILQRERMGGIALKRNQHWAGNTVSWRFDGPDDAMQVALLMPGATPSHFKVIAYNTSAKTITAHMDGNRVTAGRWHYVGGRDNNDDGKIDDQMVGATRMFERSQTIDLTFPPHQTVVYEFKLEQAEGGPVNARADIGVGNGDVVIKGRDISVTVHSLGDKPTPAGQVQLLDATGKTLSSAAFPALSAPVDLLHKTAVVRLKTPAGGLPQGAHLKLVLDGAVPEITQLNNEWALQP